MDFKVRSSKIEPGKYELSYGKGKKKLTATAELTDTEWVLPEGDGNRELPQNSYDTKRDLMNAWGVWAQEAYGSAAAESPSPQDGQPADPKPPPPSRKGPPKHKAGPPKHKAKSGPPQHKPRPSTLEFEYNHDPFDGRFRYPSDHDNEALRKQTTPLGVLVEIEQWLRRHDRELSKAPAFDPLIHDVRACLARECPDFLKDASNVESKQEIDEAESDDPGSREPDDTPAFE